MDMLKLDFITLSELMPDSKRKNTEDVTQYLKKFEDCLKNYESDFPFSLLHYAFVFRRFDVVGTIKDALSSEDWIKAMHLPGPANYEWITPLVCAKWNCSYIYGYDSKNGTSLGLELELMMDEDEIYHIDEVIEYTDIVDEKKHKNVFDIFFGKQQPLLDVFFYNRQELASKQVEKNGVSLVMDEVGTGKTVSALYAIRNVIENCKLINRQAHILIICPHNKMEDWQNDIRRQLGRYSHIVQQSDNGDMYRNDLKEAFFKSSEEIIMISGQKGGSDGKGVHTELKNSIKHYSFVNNKWDIVIIDEGHIAFKNYSGISADKAIILTATPIVVNSTDGCRKFNDYMTLLGLITGKNIMHRAINPIEKYMPDENDIYVNWFKEDMNQKSAKRIIRFEYCERDEERNTLFYDIYYYKKPLTALQYDQDDDYLFSEYNKIFPENQRKLTTNFKLEKLIEILEQSQKSYIIFCEHKDVVLMIYNRLKDEFPEDFVAEKHGKHESYSVQENIQNGQLIDTLINEIREGRRVLFVTTGKTGGTGLNLGEFDGVIHYELPFTSIELEQRFGRVDRIDTKQNGKERDMIFLLNKCSNDENDNEINRMLYYCVNKIDITCKFMPIRNTVLYYPEFILRNKDSLRMSLHTLRRNDVLSDTNEKRIKSFKLERHNFEKKIKSDVLNYPLISKNEQSVHKCVENALNEEMDSRISESFWKIMNEYLAEWNAHESEINNYDREYRQFLRLRKQVNNWLAVIGTYEIDNEEIFAGHKETDEYDCTEIDEDDCTESIKETDYEVVEEDKETKTVHKQVNELIEKIDNCNFENLELNGFSSDSVFCFKNNRICRSKVKAYRNGEAWS